MTSTAIKSSLRLWRWRRNRWDDKQADLRGEKRKKLLIKIRHAEKIINRRKRQLANSKPPRRTKDGWMPGVARHYGSSGTSWQVACAPKGLLHTTEGHGDATGTLDAKRAWPHFEVMENGGILQYFPLTIGARALAHNGPPTNGAHCSQIEVAGFAAHTDWPAAQKASLKKVMRFIEAETGVERASHHPFVSGGGARLGANEWLSARGWLGHQHVPGNDHTDPGNIDATLKELLS